MNQLTKYPLSRTAKMIATVLLRSPYLTSLTDPYTQTKIHPITWPNNEYWVNNSLSRSYDAFGYTYSVVINTDNLTKAFKQVVVYENKSKKKIGIIGPELSHILLFFGDN